MKKILLNLNKTLTMLAGATILASTSIGPSKASDVHLFTRFTRMVVLGDSLSDVGNLPALTFLTPHKVRGLVVPPPPRYDRGRFSNGPVAVEYLAKKYHLRLQPSLTGFGPTDSVSFAYGGSGTGISNVTPGNFSVRGLLGQVKRYIDSLNEVNGIRQDLSTLFVVWSGANDYILPLLSAGVTHPPNPNQIVENIKTAILRLHAHGAYYFLVPNLPNLGKLPLCLALHICQKLSTLTHTHNTLLEQALTDIEATQRDIELIRFDAYRLFEKILTHPRRYGFSDNVQAPGPAAGCLFQDPSTFDPANCDLVSFNTNQVFWDEEHPTTRVHKIWGRSMWRAIQLENLWPPRPHQPSDRDEDESEDEFEFSLSMSAIGPISKN